MLNSSRFPFPGVSLANREQFENFRAAHSNLLDYRYSYECGLASAEAVVERGLCPITLNQTHFSSQLDGGQPAGQGRIVPDWRNQQVCDNGVDMPDRAVVHFALYNSPESRLGRVLLISNSAAVEALLGPFSTSVDYREFDQIRERALYDTIFVVNKLEQGVPLYERLSRLYDALAPDGKIYFHHNFHYNSDVSVMREFDGMAFWSIGWDFNEKLLGAGFKNAHAVTFWAPELGYLGAANILFEAKK